MFNPQNSNMPYFLFIASPPFGIRHDVPKKNKPEPENKQKQYFGEMWAAFKSDLAEFASGAAEETSVVASKVGVTLASDTDATTAPPSSSASGVDGSVLFSMGDKGLKGIQGVSSMLRNTAAAAVATNSNKTAVPAFESSGGGNPSPALSSMLAQAAGEDDEGEDELGWDDDDDDDLDLDEENSGVVIDADDNKNDVIFEEQLGQPPKEGEGNKNPACVSSPDRQVVADLQSKIDAVEKERARLQIEHRTQTAELVELRAKVEELEQQESKPTAEDREEDEKVRALEEEVAKLKLQLSEQPASLMQENEKVVAGLIQEKGTLEQQLNAQRKHNEKILLHTSQDTPSSSSDTQELLLQEYQQQIELLIAKPRSLHDTEFTSQEQLNHTKQTEQLLLQMKDYHTLALKEAQKSKAELTAAEEELRSTKMEMEEVQAKLVQAANFAVRLQEEAAKAEAQQQEQELEKPVSTLSTSTPEDVPGGTALVDSSEMATNASSNSSPVKIGEDEELSDTWGADGEELSDDWGDEGN